jgi:hypothetical protein
MKHSLLYEDQRSQRLVAYSLVVALLVFGAVTANEMNAVFSACAPTLRTVVSGS